MARTTEVHKPFDISLNREQADMLLRGLRTLPESDRKAVIYQALVRDIESIVTIWDRRIKNEKIVLEERRKIKQNAKAAEAQLSGQKHAAQTQAPPPALKPH